MSAPRVLCCSIPRTAFVIGNVGSSSCALPSVRVRSPPGYPVYRVYSLPRSLAPLILTLDALITTTWSPVFRCGVNVGLCLPRRILATLLARRPRTWSVASTTNQSLFKSAAFAVHVFCLLTRSPSKSLPSTSGPRRGPSLAPGSDLSLAALRPPTPVACALAPPPPARRRCCVPGLGEILPPPTPARRNRLAARPLPSASRAPWRRATPRPSSSSSSRAAPPAAAPPSTSRRRRAWCPRASSALARGRAWPDGPGSGIGIAATGRSTERGSHPAPP